MHRLISIAMVLIVAGAASAEPRWARTLGGAAAYSVGAAAPTRDDGTVLAGYAVLPGAPRNYDLWCAKLDSRGAVVWDKTYGGPNFESAYTLKQTADGGFIVIGAQRKVNLDDDIWCLKLDAAGSVQWQATYGGPKSEFPGDVIQTHDGGYLFAVQTQSYGYGFSDVWVVKLNSEGSFAWQKSYGGQRNDYVDVVRQLPDGGFIAVGSTESSGAGRYDVWCARLSSTGDLVWQQTYGGAESDSGRAIELTPDGGFIVAADTGSFGSAHTNLWILKLNSLGTVLSERVYSALGSQGPSGLVVNPDGSFVVAGYSAAGGEARSWDLYCVGFDAAGTALWQRLIGGSGIEELASCIAPTGDGGYLLAGDTRSYGASTSVLVARVGSQGEIDSSCADLSLASLSAPTETQSVVRGSWHKMNLTAAAATLAGYATGTTGIVSSVLCEAPDLPDLTGAFGRLRQRGNRVRTRFTCANDGASDAGPFTLRVYLSGGPTLDGTSRLITTKTVRSLATDRSIRARVRGSVAHGQGFLVAVLDPEEQVNESDETNNVISVGL